MPFVFKPFFLNPLFRKEGLSLKLSPPHRLFPFLPFSSDSIFLLNHSVPSQIITLFLSLVAIQFVVESELPSSSYVLPTRQLVIVSYLVLLLVCFEALVVYNVASWERVFNWFQGMRRAKSARASLVAAQQRREEAKAAATKDDEAGRASASAAAADEERASSVAAADADAEGRAALGGALSSSPRAAEGGERGGKNEVAPKSAAGAAVRFQPQPEKAARPSLSGSFSRSFSRSFSFGPLPRGSPWSWSRSKRFGNGPSSVSAAAASPGAAAAGCELGEVDDFAVNGDGTIARARRRRQDIARQLDSDARASWYAYVAWR